MPLAKGAPDLSSLKKNETHKVHTKKETKPVTKKTTKTTSKSSKANDFAIGGTVNWSLLGVGGAGKKAAIRFSENHNIDIPITTIDTSGSEAAPKGVNVIRMENLNGSGKYRKENSKEITNAISKYVGENPFTDVTVIVHSLSGGSGSVIGPLLVGEILRANKVVIVIGIVDTDSDIDTVNAFNTLESFKNFAENRKSYLPIMMFDNDHGRRTVDNGIDRVLSHLVRLLNIPYDGLDMQDRIKFLKPNTFDGVTGGVKLINLSQLPDGDWEDIGLITPDSDYSKLDATLIISPIDGDNLKLKTKCKVTFRGYFEGDNDDDRLIASVGYNIPQSLIDKLNETLHSFRNMDDAAPTKIESEYEIGKTSSNGLVM